MYIPRSVLFAGLFLLLATPSASEGSTGAATTGTTTQEFIITAYYSPVPGQCCYVTGSYESDVALNGNGTNGADGTQVYPGMAAGPSSYPFGTTIVLPGIGVVTVHDRGGAIKVLDSGAHRLDLWVGFGEEGLARALQFGVQHVTGTVYAAGTKQPPDAFNLAALPSPFSQLKSYVVRTDLLALRPKKSETGMSTFLLQEALRKLGYLNVPSSGTYGENTVTALAKFNADFGIGTEPSQALSPTTAAYLTAELERHGARLPVVENVNASSDASTIRDAQRTLRFLGYYRGRTSGVYDETLRKAILALQKEKSLVATESDPGAGTIGPKTRATIASAWDRAIVAERAQRLLDQERVSDLIAKRGLSITLRLAEGDTGQQVRSLQTILVQRGFLSKEKITGKFGADTRKALIAYQRSRKIIGSEKDTGAGCVGPKTQLVLGSELRTAYMEIVRSKGWDAL